MNVGYFHFSLAVDREKSLPVALILGKSPPENFSDIGYIFSEPSLLPYMSPLRQTFESLAVFCMAVAAHSL